VTTVYSVCDTFVAAQLCRYHLCQLLTEGAYWEESRCSKVSLWHVDVYITVNEIVSHRTRI